VTNLPRWSGDDWGMFRWLEDMLDDLLVKGLHGNKEGWSAQELHLWRASLPDPAIEAAWSGNMEPLRRRHPELAPFLCPAKLRRGDKRPKLNNKSERETLLSYAAGDVERIRRLWKIHYGKWKRRQGQTSAEAFAAMRWTEEFWSRERRAIILTEEDVARACKPSGTPRSARAK
jgi:hypothetical protein